MASVVILCSDEYTTEWAKKGGILRYSKTAIKWFGSCPPLISIQLWGMWKVTKVCKVLYSSDLRHHHNNRMEEVSFIDTPSKA